MKGFETHDGKIAGNRQLVESYDKAHGKRPKHMAEEHKGGEHGEGEDGMHGEIKSIVAEHGPAHKHVITKDKESGAHHSETHHESGHVHHADHGSLAEAHEHGLQAMGDDGEHTEMDLDDAHVASEANQEEMHGKKTSNIGFM
jgi:hypothetical protein